MDGIVISGVIVNGSLLGLVVFFFVRWMNRVEADRKEDRALAEKYRIKDRDEVRRIVEVVADRAERTAKAIADKAELTSRDIKERIEANRLFYAQSYSDIKQVNIDFKHSIDKLADKVGVQNGRINRLEKDLAAQTAICVERNKKRSA